MDIIQWLHDVASKNVADVRFLAATEGGGGIHVPNVTFLFQEFLKFRKEEITENAFHKLLQIHFKEIVVLENQSTDLYLPGFCSSSTKEELATLIKASFMAPPVKRDVSKKCVGHRKQKRIFVEEKEKTLVEERNVLFLKTSNLIKSIFRFSDSHERWNTLLSKIPENHASTLLEDISFLRYIFEEIKTILTLARESTVKEDPFFKRLASVKNNSKIMQKFFLNGDTEELEVLVRNALIFILEKLFLCEASSCCRDLSNTRLFLKILHEFKNQSVIQILNESYVAKRREKEKRTLENQIKYKELHPPAKKIKHVVDVVEIECPIRIFHHLCGSESCCEGAGAGAGAPPAAYCDENSSCECSAFRKRYEESKTCDYMQNSGTCPCAACKPFLKSFRNHSDLCDRDACTVPGCLARKRKHTLSCKDTSCSKIACGRRAHEFLRKLFCE